MSLLKIPARVPYCVEAHQRWLQLLKTAQELVEEDVDLQKKAAKGLRLKERNLPPQVLGRAYAQYCDLINKMYDSYLNSLHLQRAPYMLEIISVLLKRLYELRNELVYLILNDYIYVDAALTQLFMTPYDIQIVVPYHFPLESRPDSLERVLQTMWADAVKRKKKPDKIVSIGEALKTGGIEEEFQLVPEIRVPPPEVVTIESCHTVISEEYIQAIAIQKHERFRQWFAVDFKAKCLRRRMYFAEKTEDAPMEIRIKAAELIQSVYRKYMRIKRQRMREANRDVLLGIIPDPHKTRLNFVEENNKMYERRRQQRMKIHETYRRELEREQTRLVVFKKADQIDDITVQVHEWFKEWYYGYGFFPEYPYENEGGTIMVIRGDYPTIEEKREADEKHLKETSGKTKDMIKQEKLQAKQDAALKAEAGRVLAKKDAQNLLKLRFNPFTDPGYKPKKSEHTGEIIEALQRYRAAWSFNDHYLYEKCDHCLYGYMKSVLTEDLMDKLHRECRQYVDQLMRLDLKLLIKMQQKMYKRVGWKYPKTRPRAKPKQLPIPKSFNVDSGLLKDLEGIFDLGILSKPTSKIKDIEGDLNYAAYECNIQDPDARFPPPGYGDVRRRLLLSCVFGSGSAQGAKRNKSVMLLGPARSGKSFLVDCVAGELNAVKIDITPEVFSAVCTRPAEMMQQVFLAAKAFQPAVIFLRNIEKVFAKKVPPEDKYLRAKSLRVPLTKLIQKLQVEDKVILMATCSFPSSAQAGPMTSLFSEIILVPITDYSSVQMFFYNKLQSIRSMPRDYCVQPIAQMLQGYGFGSIIEAYNQVMDADRIVKLSLTPLSPMEFLEVFLEKELEPVTIQDYQEYVDFFIANSSLKGARQEFNVINTYRQAMYRNMEKKMAQKEDKEKRQK